MGSRAIIGIHAGSLHRSSRRDPEVDRLLTRWIGCLSAAGAIPVVVPDLSCDEGLDELLDLLHGFVVAGERDACDACRDGSDGPCWEPMAEFRLVRAIARRQVPFVGIGLGFQLMNLALGGTVRPLDLDARGQPFHAYPHNPRHPLEPKDGSLMQTICGARPVTVNSSHRCAIDRLADGLVATAVSSDGVVEAFEALSEDWFALSVQFQPDDSCDRHLSSGIFDTLVDEAMAPGEQASDYDQAGCLQSDLGLDDELAGGSVGDAPHDIAIGPFEKLRSQ